MTLSVIASSSLSPGLRGAMTKWYLEVLPGIFVADVTARVRDELWEQVNDWVITGGAPGYAALVYAAPTEQGYTIRTAGANRYEPVDFDGLTLIARRRQQASHNSGPGTTMDSDDWGF